MTISDEKITWHILSGYRTVAKGPKWIILPLARAAFALNRPYRIVATYGGTYHRDHRNLYTEYTLKHFIEAHKHNP